MDENIVNIFSTKFLITLLFSVIVSIGWFMNKISSAEFMPFVLGILGIYGITNTISKFSTAGGTN